MELLAIALLLPAIGEALLAIDDGRRPPVSAGFPLDLLSQLIFCFASLYTRVWRDEALVKLLEEALALHSSI